MLSPKTNEIDVEESPETKNHSPLGSEIRHDDDPADPLNWSIYWKVAILLQVSLLSALGGLNTASINPALVQLAKEFNITSVKASYQTTICIALNGLAPFIWIPLANTYGRRPVYLFTTLLGFASILGSAYAKTWGQLLAARVFNGVFPASFALGAATVTDLFPVHQRGRAMGIFTVLTANGSHIAPLVGGPLGQYCGWRWIFKFCAIVDGTLFLITFFCLPETLSHRSVSGNASSAQKSAHSRSHPSMPYLQRMNYLKPWTSRNKDLHIHASDFVWPSLKMAQYPTVLFPGLYYAAQYGFASILPAVTVAHIFTEFFHWDTLKIGLAYGTALTVGCSLGELFAGPVLDHLVKRALQRSNKSHGEVVPTSEARLQAVWTGEILVPAGLLIYGFTLQYHAHWIAPLIGMGTACFGIQVITTTMYTYSIDSHPTESAATSQFFNLVRQTFGLTFAFYAVDMGERIGFQFTFLFFALSGGVLAFVPIAALMVWGRRVREWEARVERREA